jgi:hypothetical protein
MIRVSLPGKVRHLVRILLTVENRDITTLRLPFAFSMSTSDMEINEMVRRRVA